MLTPILGITLIVIVLLLARFLIQLIEKLVPIIIVATIIYFGIRYFNPMIDYVSGLFTEIGKYI